MTLPIIALIGQKNAGKSTLFNRLTCTNDALVANYSGLTRDRQYGYLCCKLFKSIVVDTGGIERICSSNMEMMRDNIYYQTVLAIKEADIILLVIDGRFGETSVDYNIISFLRKLEKSIFVVINKIDNITNNKRSMFFGGCYDFGIENVITISAMHGYGINCLLKKIYYQIQKETCDNNNSNRMLIVNQDVIAKKFRLKQFLSVSSSTTTRLNVIILAILGRPNSGKSTFINNILGKNRMITSDIPGTTRDSIYTSTMYNGKHYILIDTAGIRKKKKINNNIIEQISIKKSFQVIKNAHIILFMIDADIGISDQDLFALKYIMNVGMSLIIVVNKWDNVSVIMRRTLKEIIYKQIDFITFVQVRFISALYGNGIKDLFQSIQIIYNGLVNIRSVNTSKFTRIMRMAITQCPPPLFHNNTRIQPKYVHVGGYSPLILIMHGSHVSKLSDNYQRYLKKSFYNNLNIKGVILHLQCKDSFNPFDNNKRFY